MDKTKRRGSGILCHIISLPSEHGIGDLGPEAYRFADFLQETNQHFWQILPMNPTDSINGHSPYSCFSAFAGNHLLISPDLLVKEGLIEKKDLRSRPAFSKTNVEYQKVVAYKDKIFHTAYNNFLGGTKGKLEFATFSEEHKEWLDDFALFVAIKADLGGKVWSDWPKDIRDRKPKTIARLRKQFASHIDKIKFLQYLFFKQWNLLKAYCTKRDIAIIGDIPIYVNYDSAEVWTHPQYFKLDAHGKLKFVSGVPPDYFSKTGQRWGNPVYDWARLRREKYTWWICRIEHNFHLFDIIRIDHFRGFASFWQIPAREKIAVFGKWVKGPGKGFFQAVERQLPDLPIIAEDLGYITPDVTELMKKFNFPGMRVMLFAFASENYEKNTHLPDNYVKNSVAYTGTHDNNTIEGWYKTEASAQEKEHLAEYLGVHRLRAGKVHWSLIEKLFESQANIVIVPLQDVLGLGQEARINKPATNIHNWQWRFKSGVLTSLIKGKLKRATKASRRD